MSYLAGVFCQTPANDDEAVTSPAKSFFKTSLSYLSNAVYQGRKDSAVISYITPSISYVNKSGWNLTASLSYAPNAGIKEIELITLETGYEHKFNSSFSSNAYAAAYFYNQFSSAVQSTKNAGVGVGIDYSPKDVLNLSADVGMSVAKSPDIASSVSLGRPFYFGSTGHDWGIVPAAAIIAGTQEYYSGYYSTVKFNQSIRAKQLAKRIARGLINGGNSSSAKKITVVSGKNFSILDYELSVPVTYDEKRWGLFLTPIYAIPVHPLTYYEEGSATPITEKLTNSFYFTVGAYVKF